MHSDNLQTRFGHLQHRSELLVTFPDPSQNIVRRNVEFTLAQIKEKRRLRDDDQNRMRQSMDGLRDLVQRLDRQFEVPDQIPAETISEREKKTLEIEESIILAEHVPSVPPSDARPVGNTGMLIDSQNMRRMEIMNQLVEFLSVEVAGLRAEHDRTGRVLDEKDNRIMDLEALIHGQQLKHIALEQLIVTLKKKAQGQSTATYNFTSTSTGEGKSTVSEAVAIEAKKVIEAERLKIISEAEQRIFVSVGEAQGPLYDPAIVMLHIHGLHHIRERLAPQVFHSMLGKFRTQIRTVGEVCDGYEFRADVDDHFAFAFQTPKAALRFALQVQSHMLYGVEWEPELDNISATQFVKDVSGKPLFRGPRVVVAVHHGESRGVLDPFTGLCGFDSPVFDIAARMERVGRPGLIIVSNKVMRTPEVQHFLTSEGQGFVTDADNALASAVAPGAAEFHLFHLAPAVAKARLASSDPSAKIQLHDAFPVELVGNPLPPSGAIVSLRAEGFDALEDDCGHAVLEAACKVYRREVYMQLLYSMTGKVKPTVLRHHGDDRFLILFERVCDALHFTITLQDALFEADWAPEFLSWGCGAADGKLLRGVRLQSGIHWCTSITSKGVDPFSGVQRAVLPESEFPVGLSLLARGGETVLSQAAMDAAQHESFPELDVRCRHVTILKTVKKVVFKQTQAETLCHVAMSSRFFGRQEAFRKLLPLPAELPFDAVPFGDVAIVTVGISGAFKLVSANYPAFMDARLRLDGIAVATARRFGGVKCALADPAQDIAVNMFVFWSVKDAVCFAAQLHEVAMTGYFPDGLEDPVYTHKVLTPDDALLFRGFRLRVGIHRSDRVHVQPGTCMYSGPDVAESVFLSAAAFPGHTLLSQEAQEALTDQFKLLPEFQFSPTKQGDFFGVTNPAKVCVVLPRTLMARFPGAPLHQLDPLVEALRRLAVLSKAVPKESPEASQQSFYPLAQPCEGNLAFAVIRIPNSAALIDRVPQAMETAMALYLSAIREATKGFEGYEIAQDVDAVFVLFSDVVSAVRWAAHLQESLMAIRWPDQIIALEAGKEVKSSVKGSTRSTLTFRGLRSLIVIDFGKPQFYLDSATRKIVYYGAVPLRALGLSQWGHGGQTVLTQHTREALAAPELGAVDRLPPHLISSVGPRSVTDEDTVDLFLFIPQSLASRHFPSFPDTPKHERFGILANDIAEVKRTIHSQDHSACAVFHAPGLELGSEPLKPGNTQAIDGLRNELQDNTILPAVRLYGGRIVATFQSALACTFPTTYAAYLCACFINTKLLTMSPATQVDLTQCPYLAPSVVNEKVQDPETGRVLWNGVRVATTIDAAAADLRSLCEICHETEGGDIVVTQRGLRELAELEAIRPVVIRWLHHSLAGSDGLTRASLLPSCIGRRSFLRVHGNFTWSSKWWSEIGAAKKPTVQDVSKSAADEQFDLLIAEIDERTDAAARAEKLAELRRLWKRERFEKDELSAKLEIQRRRKEEALGQLARAETTAAVANTQLLAAHNALRIFRNKADVFIHKASVDNALFGNDSTDFVLQFMHSVQIHGSAATSTQTTDQKKKPTKEPEISVATASVGTVSQLRELFNNYTKQSIDDEGNESRSAKQPEKLAASMIGHMAKLFVSLEKMAKSKDRLNRGGVPKGDSNALTPRKPASSRPVSGSSALSRFSETEHSAAEQAE